MKPVYQDQFGKDGVCEQAALASLLGLPLSQVPGYHAATFDVEYREFLKRRGYIMVFLGANSGESLDCFYLAFGSSVDTGRRHCCVYRKGELAHDSHPGHHGLVDIEEICLIVPSEIDIGPWRRAQRK
jgi:hypothetical protein